MQKKKTKRLVIPASIAVLTLAGACQLQPAPNTDDPCTQKYGPDCVTAENADGGFVELPDGGGPQCLC